MSEAMRPATYKFKRKYRRMAWRLYAHTSTAASQRKPKSQTNDANGPGTFLPIYAPDPRLRKRSRLTSADAARFSVGRRRCRCTAGAIRRWRCWCTSGLIRCRWCWSRSCCHHYRAIRVCGNDGLQTHRRHENDHDKQHDREFPGHCASGDGHTPRDTLPLTTGKSSHPRYGDVPYRYTPSRPDFSLSFR